MRLAHEENEQTLEEFNNIEALRVKTDSLKIDIELEEKEIDNLKLKYDRLDYNLKKTCVFIVISAVLLAWILSNPASFVMNMISYTYLAIIIFGGIVSFVGYTIRCVMKYLPMYINCKKEEKGTSKDAMNYVYQIKLHERKKRDFVKELEEAQTELNTYLK
ncbi:MAG: hypothetical protein J6L77_11380 [Coprococcus sp.]|nr:hypothetical protein [Coprococcus sp.]